MTGKEMCSLTKDQLLARTMPVAFVGDILWAHLEILQKENNGGSPKSNTSNSSRYCIFTFRGCPRCSQNSCPFI